MLLARLVVHQHALLHGFGGDGLVDVLRAFDSKLRGDFKRVVGRAAVATGVARDQLQRLILRGDLHRAEATFFVLQCAAQQRGDLLPGERLQHIDPATREQRRDDLEGGILSGRADQSDCAALDIRQECVLLRLVEAVNLVDEENGPRVHLGGLRCGGHHMLDLLDPAHYGGEFNKVCLRSFGDDLRESGFAHPRRTPEDHRP